MISIITGKLLDKSPQSVIVDTGGVGYEIFIPLNVFCTLPSLGNSVTFFTSFIVREQMQALFGFETRQDKQLFETVLQVSGIGPKIAMSILGHLPPKDFLQAIHHQDIDKITKVPGIGKKGAQRLLIELQGKLPGFQKMDQMPVSLQHTDKTLVQDAQAALQNLGYNSTAAGKAIEKAIEKNGNELSLPDLISACLQQI